MGKTSFEIRVCQNCGLRYPLVKDRRFSERCPACLGQTAAVLEQTLECEPPRDYQTGDPKINLRVLLDNVRSAWNVGSIFRSADGFNFQHAYLCGITPTPENTNVRKTALGAEHTVGWSAHKNAVELIGQLKTDGFEIWALEQTKNSTPIHSALRRPNAPKKIVLIIGNEVAGVDPGIFEIADRIVHLPMRGRKRSFNAAIAFAIAAQILSSQYG
jgi:23S rRNA (guanosine2251-2'-O)-methyltransferase